MQDRQEIFHRSPHNPILTPHDLPFRAVGVLNPGAAERDGEVILLLRVENVNGISDIYRARSRNGATDWQIDKEPVLRHGLKEWHYEEWGCEDARVTYVPEDACWYVTYVAFSQMGPAVAIARTTDMENFERLCLLGATNDKDGVLFPARFGGDYAILHRPDAGGYQHIWSAYSRDLIRWGEPHVVLQERGGPEWDAVRVGAGPPPIRTAKGWLLIYHGVKTYGAGPLYRAGVALLDSDVPYKVVARSHEFVFQPEAPYELSGLLPNVVFPTGALIRGDEIWMYYGAADRCVGLATAKLSDLLAVLDV
ncbi:MAG: glycosidase [Phycisphaerae bacterium]|nr:glycosidase [Phycisphaerae bacterium]